MQQNKNKNYESSKPIKVTANQLQYYNHALPKYG